MRLLAALCALAIVAAGALTARADEQGFMPLWNGKDLSGWQKVGGGATYRVEGDSIVGEVGPGANTFLRTEKTYGDFILKLEAKLDVPGNSGIQIRSHQQNGNGRVFGYQCEIDPSARAWTGGIYDEGRRGWLYPLSEDEKARKAFKAADWNEFVIQAIGPTIKTWVNGVPCADLIDPMDMEGFIALQVHSGKQGRIRWRNIRLKDLGRSEWRPLWDGKTLEGWEKIGGGEWKIEEGAIHGTAAKTEPRHGHLISKNQYGDFAVRLKYFAKQGNSGLYFRTEKKNDAVGVAGFQAEIDPEKDAGGLYETSGRGWVVQPKPEDVKKWYKPNAWNEMSVVALGNRLVVHVNGFKTAEVKNDPGRMKGHIAVQLHGGQDMDVLFKDIEIMEIQARGEEVKR
jgi:3-keto-disaccharide hydrolase